MKGSFNSLFMGCFFVLFFSYQIFGQSKVVKLNKKIPIDRELRYGELKNGFKYYLKRDENSKSRLQLYFLVKVGAENELRDQFECAHLLEHVALNSTKYFSDVRAFLRQHGIVWGRDFNGVTSAKGTIYNFSIPEGNQELLLSCLGIIKNWANGEVSFDSAIISAEKGAVQQELSMYTDDFSRMRKEFYAGVVGTGNHNGRVLADTRPMLAELKPSQLMRFYRDWYVPSREGLVILGDFDVDSMEQWVRGQFGGLMVKPPKGKLEEPYFSPLKLDGRNGVCLVKKNERKIVEGKIVLKSAYCSIATYGDLKADLVRTLLSYLIDFRLRHASRNEGEPSYSVHYDRVLSEFGKPFSSLVLDFQCDSVQLKSTYTGLVEELFRIDLLGFSVEEVDNAKSRLKVDFEHSYMKGRSLELNDCIGNFMRGEAIPAPETRKRLVFSILDGLVVEDISRFLKEWPFTRNRDAVFFIPRAYREGLVSVEKVREWNKEAERAPLRQFQYIIDEETNEDVRKIFPALMTEEQRRLLGNNLSPLTTSKIESVSAVSIRLENGIQVVFKQFSSDADSVIYIHGLKHLDASVRDKRDSLLEKYSPRLISSSGPGGYGADEWMQYKMNKGIIVSHDFKSEGVSIIGSGHPRDVEDILQAIRLSIVNPKIDCVFFEKWKRQQIEHIENSKDESSTPLGRYLSSLSRKFSPLIVLKKESDVLGMTSSSVLEKYKMMYVNDGGYTFFVCGKFDLDSVAFLLNKYIGTIPVSSYRYSAIFSSIHGDEIFPQRQIFYDSSLAISRIDVLFPVTMPERACPKVTMQIITDEFKRLIVDKLRTKEGISYVPIVSLSRVVGNKYVLAVYFDCANDRIDDGVRFVKEEFSRLRDIDTQRLLFHTSKDLVKSQIRKKANKPPFWSEYFAEAFFGGWNIDRLADCNTVINDVTVETVCDMMRLFSPDQAMVFVLRPKDSSSN